jgi:hypothetical protein
MQALTLVLIGPDLQACTHLSWCQVQAHALSNLRCFTVPQKRSCAAGKPPDVLLCSRCTATKASLQVALCACRYEELTTGSSQADLTMLFHPGLAANQAQVVETCNLWGGQAKQQMSAPCKPLHRRYTTTQLGSKGLTDSFTSQWQHEDNQKGKRQAEMRSLRRAWKPSLTRLQGATFFTAFSFAEAKDELAELNAAGIKLSVGPQWNPFASLAPRGVPIPAWQGAMCKGSSPLWSELASPEPNVTQIAAMDEDWLCVNKVIFGCL